MSHRAVRKPEAPIEAHVGVGATRPRTVAAVIEIPTTGPGKGSVISAATTVANSAVAHAAGARPTEERAGARPEGKGSERPNDANRAGPVGMAPDSPPTTRPSSSRRGASDPAPRPPRGPPAPARRPGPSTNWRVIRGWRWHVAASDRFMTPGGQRARCRRSVLRPPTGGRPGCRWRAAGAIARLDRSRRGAPRSCHGCPAPPSGLRGGGRIEDASPLTPSGAWVVACTWTKASLCGGPAARDAGRSGPAQRVRAAETVNALARKLVAANSQLGMVDGRRRQTEQAAATFRERGLAAPGARRPGAGRADAQRRCWWRRADRPAGGRARPAWADVE
jgi:hypothetical protein